jgi:hypothetical protein
MQRYRNFLVVAGLVLSVAALSFSGTVPVAANGSGSFYLSPASQSVASGSTLSLTLYEDSGSTSVNALQANLTYSSNLQFVSADYGSSAFSVQAASSGKNGSLTIARGATASVSGARTVGVVTFKAIAGGTATVKFGCINGGSCTNGDALVASANSSNVLTTQTNGSYTITGSAANTSSSSGLPQISGVVVTDVTDTSATVSWQTDQPATSVVNYGTTTKLGLSAQAAGLTTSHHVVLSNSIVKGATYYFAVSSALSTGASSTSSVQHFTTTGFAVTIIVNNKQGKPVAHATVTIGNQSATTNSNGQAVFQNVPANQQQVVIKVAGKETKRSITVGKVNPATKGYENQLFSLVAAQGNNTWLYGVLGAVVVLAGIVLFVVRPFTSSRGTASQPVSGVPVIPVSSSSTDDTPPTLPDQLSAQEPGEVVTPQSNKPKS